MKRILQLTTDNEQLAFNKNGRESAPVSAGSADVPSAQRAKHAQFLTSSQSEVSRFALRADGTSALPA